MDRQRVRDEQEVATQAAKNYTLPLQVSFFEEELQGTVGCFGTIRRLKLKLLSIGGSSGSRLVGALQLGLVKPQHDWSGRVPPQTLRIAVVDMLIEVNGHGLCGSGVACARVLADVVDEADVKTTVRAEDVCGANITQYTHEDGSPDGGESGRGRKPDGSERAAPLHLSSDARRHRPIRFRTASRTRTNRDAIATTSTCSTFAAIPRRDHNCFPII